MIQFLQCSAYLKFKENLATEKQANNKSFQIKSHSKRGKNYNRFQTTIQTNMQMEFEMKDPRKQIWLFWWTNNWNMEGSWLVVPFVEQSNSVFTFWRFLVVFFFFLQTYMQNRNDNSCWKAKNLIRSTFNNNNFYFNLLNFFPKMNEKFYFYKVLKFFACFWKPV